MRILLDQGLPRSTALLLTTAGFDAVHVGDIGLAAASDPESLDRARAERRVLVTLDADFHAILATSRATEPSVIRWRIEGLEAQALFALLERVFALCHEDLEHGALVSVELTRVRVRRLPIGN